MTISFKDTNSFEIYILDLMEAYEDKLKTAEDLEHFSEELHQSIEMAIQDALYDGFNDINPDDYNPCY